MIVSWMTTNRCNLKCKHCYQNAGGSREGELSTTQARSLIDGIARAGFRIMIFSGGEALMRPDILELVSYAASKGLRPVFGTNGTLLTKEMVKGLKESGAMAMGISLDSLSPRLHNDFRGDETAFERTLEGIDNCRSLGLPFQLHTTVMDWNQGEILDLIDFAVEKGAIASYLFFLIPVGRGAMIEESALEVQAYEELLRKIMRKQKEIPIPIKPTCAPQFTRVARQLGVPLDKRFSRGCLAGLTYCVVSPVGMVRPCAYMTEEAGNIREQPFDQIWRESPLFARLRTKDYGGKCGGCDHQDICGGCRARAAYYHEGDFMAEDSYCAYQIFEGRA